MNGRDSLSMLFVSMLVGLPTSGIRRSITPLPVAEANDNRRPAGIVRGDTLFLDLDVRMARWYPEASDGAFIEAAVVGETGHAPQVPAPLIRAPEGTIVVARLTNALTDSSVTWHGLSAKPGSDSITLRPGESRTTHFAIGRAGTYAYSAAAGKHDLNLSEREQGIGAFVVDRRGARPHDRVFVLNIWGQQVDPKTFRNALTINGHAWPYTERIEAHRGDTLRWRLVNGTVRHHPMHLHGFYYRILARGDGARDTAFVPGEREKVVTQTMPPFSTMAIDWVANREGNWLFHCHLSFHVNGDARFATGGNHEDHMSGDVRRHMSGLVLGIDVKPRGVAARPTRTNARAMRLLVQEGKPRGRAPRALSFVLQNGTAPAADSVELPGTTLVLTRGQPADITVVNRLKEPTAVHWHGIELESWSDGVAGWSGAMNRLAPAIAPGDSFTAHLTLPRAGTFIYHTHLNDVEQLTSGLYGAIIVLEAGQRLDARTDHLFIVGWDGPQDPPHLVVNGDSAPPPLVLARGVHHRLRFVFIGAVGGEPFALVSIGLPVTWRPVARDGYTMTAGQQREQAAYVQGWAGQTYDFDFDAREAREYLLVAGDPAKPVWSRRIVVQ